MIYSTLTKFHLICVWLLFLCTIIDLGQFFLAGSLKIPLLLSFYSTIIMQNNNYFSIITAFLQCLESFCFYNSFFLALLCLIPIWLCALFFKKNLYPSRLHSVILTFIALIIQIYLIEGYFLSIWPMISYTIIRIAGTLFITISFSLTLNMRGVQDNRA